jgi:hypothetical protein
MQNALDDYQDDFAKLALLSYTNGTPIPPHDIDSILATTDLIMLCIASHLLADGKAAISESGMKILLNQAEKYAMEFVQAKSVQPSLNSAQASDILSPTWSSIARYTAVLHATIKRHLESVLQLLKLSATIKPLSDFSTCYDKLRGAFFPSYLDWLPSSRTWVGRKYQSKNSRFLTIKPKMMLLNYTLHPCHLKCPPRLLLSPPSVQPPGMLLPIKSHMIPFFPLVKLVFSENGKIPSSPCKYTTTPPDQFNRRRSRRQGR